MHANLLSLVSWTSFSPPQISSGNHKVLGFPLPNDNDFQVCGCYSSVRFHVLQLLPVRFTQPNLCCIDKIWIQNQTSLDLVMVIISVCLLISLIVYTGPPDGVHYTKSDIKCDLLFGITQCYNCILCISFFTNHGWIGCLVTIDINIFTW